MEPAAPEKETETAVEHAVCLGCGCACDDIGVKVRAGRIVETRNACALGAAWFGDGAVPGRARVDGRDVTTADAIDEAARLLTGARRVLVYLAPDLACEAQREAVALADRLRASALDSVTSVTAIASILAAQERGRAGATLGEIRNRADAIVFWGVDPAYAYPRYWTRYAPEPAGVHVPEGRGSRRVIAVDVGDSSGPADADLRVALGPEHEVAALTLLAERVRPGSARGGGQDAERTELDGRVGELAVALLAGRYVTIVADAEPDDRQVRDAGRSAALIALAQALNASTRCALSLLRAGGNRSGADAVMTSHTGYPAAVDFARGYPRYRPHDGAAGERLTRGGVDAVLIAGSAALIPHAVLPSMMRTPSVVIGPRASESVLASSRVLVDTGVAGIHDGGMALRMDDVPLPLRPSMKGPASAEDLLRALRRRVGDLGAR